MADTLGTVDRTFGCFYLGGRHTGKHIRINSCNASFRRYAERKTSWKRPLLFIQFAGMTFILGFLMVVFCQYHMAMNKDLGYNPERVVMGWKKLGSNRQNAKSFL